MEANSQSLSQQTSSSKRLKSILLIDDDEITNFYNAHIIQKMGIAAHVHSELHGKAGLQYLTEKETYNSDYQRPDLILLDINMPVMNGFEFLEAYEKLSEEDTGSFLIVMLTTSMLSIDRERAEKYGCLSDFYTKPLDGTQLEDIVAKYFAQE